MSGEQQEQGGPLVCHWHPERETGLSCGRCGKSICTDCMGQHPVGVRCKECASPAPLPTYRVSPDYVARGLGAAAAAGFGGAILLSILARFFGNGFLFLFLMVAFGYVVGEVVSSAVNRRRGRPYQYIAAGGALLATAPVLLPLLLYGSFGLFGLLGVGIAVWVAQARLAP